MGPVVVIFAAVLLIPEWLAMIRTDNFAEIIYSFGTGANEKSGMLTSIPLDGVYSRYVIALVMSIFVLLLFICYSAGSFLSKKRKNYVLTVGQKFVFGIFFCCDYNVSSVV